MIIFQYLQYDQSWVWICCCNKNYRKDYSVNVSELFDLAQACVNPENFNSSEVVNENDVEEIHMTLVPGFVTSA